MTRINSVSGLSSYYRAQTSAPAQRPQQPSEPAQESSFAELLARQTAATEASNQVTGGGNDLSSFFDRSGFPQTDPVDWSSTASIPDITSQTNTNAHLLADHLLRMEMLRHVANDDSHSIGQSTLPRSHRREHRRAEDLADVERVMQEAAYGPVYPPPYIMPPPHFTPEGAAKEDGGIRLSGGSAGGASSGSGARKGNGSGSGAGGGSKEEEDQDQEKDEGKPSESIRDRFAKLLRNL